MIFCDVDKCSRDHLHILVHSTDVLNRTSLLRYTNLTILGQQWFKAILPGFNQFTLPRRVLMCKQLACSLSEALRKTRCLQIWYISYKKLTFYAFTYARIRTCTRTRSTPLATLTFARSRLCATPFILYNSIEIAVSSSECDPHLFQILLTFGIVWANEYYHLSNTPSACYTGSFQSLCSIFGWIKCGI